MTPGTSTPWTEGRSGAVSATAAAAIATIMLCLSGGCAGGERAGRGVADAARRSSVPAVPAVPAPVLPAPRTDRADPGSSPDPAGTAAAPMSIVSRLTGCDGKSLFLPGADRPEARGPWPVGSRAVTIAGLETEIWYPARTRSARGRARHRYDLREHLPAAERRKVPNPLHLPCDCHRDLPLDDAHGPYPLVIFVHGYGLFRTQSASLLAHWASHGFIVMAAEIPAISFATVSRGRRGAGAKARVAAFVEAARVPRGPLAFLEDHLVGERIGLAGHSLGGRLVGGLGGHRGVSVVISMADARIARTSRTHLTAILAGTDDAVEPYGAERAGYRRAPGPKRFVGIRGAGHMVFSDLCTVHGGRGGFFRSLLDRGVTMTGFARFLARRGCSDGSLDWEKGAEIVRYATTAALEEALLCDRAAADAWNELQNRYPEVGDLLRDE